MTQKTPSQDKQKDLAEWSELRIAIKKLEDSHHYEKAMEYTLVEIAMIDKIRHKYPEFFRK